MARCVQGRKCSFLMRGGDRNSSRKRAEIVGVASVLLNSLSRRPQNEKPRNEKKNWKLQTTLAPVRQYLQASVVPVLLAGLTELASAQPADPVAWLAQYLIDNNPRNKKGEEEKGGDGDEKMGEEEEEEGEKDKGK